jgi:phosphoglycolate phosphatase
MTARAVLFDLDGTLLDTLRDIGGAMNAVLESAGYPPHPIEDYKLMVGSGVRALVERAAPEGAFSERLLAAMREEYHKRSDRETRPYQEVPELLAALAQRGVPYAILSNKPQPLTERAAATFFPENRFTAVLGARPEVPLKPDPAAAVEAAGLSGVPPEEFLFLGDTGTDMETAAAAKMTPVGALWGFRGREELIRAGASRLIERPLELLTLL